jgi:hypothetical protein
MMITPPPPPPPPPLLFPAEAAPLLPFEVKVAPDATVIVGAIKIMQPPAVPPAAAPVPPAPPTAPHDI